DAVRPGDEHGTRERADEVGDRHQRPRQRAHRLLPAERHRDGYGTRPGVVAGRARGRARRDTREGQLALATDTFRIGAVERQPGEELGGHAPALTGVELAT